MYPLEILSCEHHSKQPDKSEKEVQSTVAVGVQCAFKEHNSTVYVIKECNKNGWHDTDIYNAGKFIIFIIPQAPPHTTTTTPKQTK